MAAATKAKTRAKAAPAKARVAVVGGGIAGLTCALKLAQSGCKVTLYEAQDRLGGNLSSSGEPGAAYQDVYPHIFPDWYANFWALFEQDLGLPREKHFAPRWSVKVLDRPPGGPSANVAPRYKEVGFTPRLKSVLETLNARVLAPEDFFLFTFLTLDLAAQPPDPNDDDMLAQLDVNGFFYSRNYSNDAIAALQDYIISVIWSIPSDMTSAKVYKRFIKHQLSSLGPNTPYSWMLKGSIQERIIDPLEARLAGKGGKGLDCRIEKGVTVRSVEVRPDGSPRILLERGDAVEEAPPVDYVVMAVPGPELAQMVMRGADGQRLVDKVPELAHLRRVKAEAIPVVNLYFTRKLPFIPEEIVGLRDSGYDLTILDISQLWDREDLEPDVSVFVLAASNAYAIPSEEPRAQAFHMIQRLREYLWFDLGEAWGEGKDIDWDRTTVRQNDHHRLFVNDVGSRRWRPVARYANLPNVFFAGDVCQTDVDMATVEAAVESGAVAAQAVQMAAWRYPAKFQMATEPIGPAPHRVYSDATFLAAKLALLPFAYSAAALSSLRDAARPRDRAIELAYATDKRALLLPLDYAVDWWRTAYWLQRSVKNGLSSGAVEGVDPADAPMGLAVRGRLWAWDKPPTSRARRQAEPLPPMASATLMALGAFSNQLAHSLRAMTDARHAEHRPPSRQQAKPKETGDGQSRRKA